MHFLLDTNVCIDYLTGRFPGVIDRLQNKDPGEVAVSCIAVAELRYGATKSARPDENHHRLDLLLEDLPTLEFALEAAASYGHLRTDLERKGQVIGPNDMLIAAQALADGLVLVTDNVGEFQRIDGLKLENWRI